MPTDKKKFSTWLAAEHGVEIRDMRETNFPLFWKFAKAGAFAKAGKVIFVKNLEKLNEESLCRKLCHELRHIERQRSKGWPLYLASYIFSQKFRRDDEVLAYTRNMEFDFLFGVKDRGPGYYVDQMKKIHFLKSRHIRIARKKLNERSRKIENGAFTWVRDNYKKYLGSK